jgi:Reverse transcriptase (RNA-dependent DNA polymerase)
MSLSTPESVQKLQTALHDKAKGSPSFRFYALYDKVYRKDVLAFAYERCKANGGAAGVDGQTFEDIEAYGEERWLDELAQELKNRTYQPLPVRRVYIPKPDGKQRPLGVPAIRDRAAEMAAVLVLEPIFEADLQPEQYAYRKDRSALDAVRHVHKLINTGHGHQPLCSRESRHPQAALSSARTDSGKARKPDLPPDHRVCPVWSMVSKGGHDSEHSISVFCGTERQRQVECSAKRS